MWWFRKRQVISNAKSLLRKLEAEYSVHPSHGGYERPTAPIDIADTLAFTFKHYDEALVVYEQILQRDPNNRNALYYKGDVLTRLERYNEALAVYEQILQRYPDASIVVYEHKGDVLTRLERYNEALAVYEQILQRYPNNIERFRAHQHKGDIFRKLHRYSEALAAYEQALQIGPNYIEALDVCDQILQLDPDNISAYQHKGDILARIARYNELHPPEPRR